MTKYVGLSPLGVFLRKLRIDRGETLKNMADKLGCSSSYLSAVEVGKKKVLDSFCNKFLQVYSLTTVESELYDQAIKDSATVINVDFRGVSHENRQLFMTFIEKLKNGEISEDMKKEIELVLKESNRKHYLIGD
ncbi:Helix-turn-helix domain protein [compost metagenome]